MWVMGKAWWEGWRLVSGASWGLPAQRTPIGQKRDALLLSQRAASTGPFLPSVARPSLSPLHPDLVVMYVIVTMATSAPIPTTRYTVGQGVSWLVGVLVDESGKFKNVKKRGVVWLRTKRETWIFKCRMMITTVVGANLPEKHLNKNNNKSGGARIQGLPAEHHKTFFQIVKKISQPKRNFSKILRRQGH